MLHRLSIMPIVTLLLVVANVLAYLLELASGGSAICQAYGLVPARFTHSGALEPLFTSLFLHDPGSLAHIAGNMAFLAIFGTIVEKSLGHLGFATLYLLAGIAGGLAHVLVGPTATDPLVGASTAICGVLAVAAALNPRLLGFVGCFMAFNIWEAITGTGGSVSVCGHIGGFVLGVLFSMIMRATSFVEEERFA